MLTSRALQGPVSLQASRQWVTWPLIWDFCFLTYFHPHPEIVGKKQDPFSEKKLLISCFFSNHSSSFLSSANLCLVFADRLAEPFTNFLSKVFFIPSIEGSHSVKCFVFQNTKLLEIRRPSSEAYCSFYKFQKPFWEWMASSYAYMIPNLCP